MNNSNLTNDWLKCVSEIDTRTFNIVSDDVYLRQYYLLRDVVFLDELNNDDLAQIQGAISNLYSFASKLNSHYNEFSELLKKFVTICDLCYSKGSIKNFTSGIRPNINFIESQYGLRKSKSSEDVDVKGIDSIVSTIEEKKVDEEKAKIEAEQKRAEQIKATAKKKAEQEEKARIAAEEKKEEERREKARIAAAQKRAAAKKKAEEEEKARAEAEQIKVEQDRIAAQQKRAEQEKERARIAAAQRRAEQERARRQRIEDEKNSRNAVIRLGIASVFSALYIYNFISDGLIYGLGTIIAPFVYFSAAFCYIPDFKNNKFHRSKAVSFYKDLDNDFFEAFSSIGGFYIIILGATLFFSFYASIFYSLILCLAIIVVSLFIASLCDKITNTNKYLHAGITCGATLGVIAVCTVLFTNLFIAFDGSSIIYTTTGDKEKATGIKYENNDIYIGDIKPLYLNYKGAKHGVGKYIYANKTYYIGSWEKDVNLNNGVLYTSDGNAVNKNVIEKDSLSTPPPTSKPKDVSTEINTLLQVISKIMEINELSVKYGKINYTEPNDLINHVLSLQPSNKKALEFKKQLESQLLKQKSYKNE
ncbi:MAG: hypothetical protein R3Y26_00385 [Rikenellaceae bacterium]